MKDRIRQPAGGAGLQEDVAERDAAARDQQYLPGHALVGVVPVHHAEARQKQQAGAHQADHRGVEPGQALRRPQAGDQHEHGERANGLDPISGSPRIHQQAWDHPGRFSDGNAGFGRGNSHIGCAHSGFDGGNRSLPTAHLVAFPDLRAPSAASVIRPVR